MPRPPRKKSTNSTYHIMLRGINKQIIFEELDDKPKFLKILKTCKEKSGFELYAYCLMDNHVHLLLKEKDESISKIVKRITTSYVLWFNRKYKRCGHLLQDRFKSEPVEKRDYFLRVVRYIHQNPLKAGLTTTIFENKWTSIHEYIGSVKGNLVDTDLAFNQFSANRSQAFELFMEYMQETNDDEYLEDKEIFRKTDKEVIEYLNEFGNQSISELQRLEKRERDSIIAKLCALKGVSDRQISRITGISRPVISQIRKKLGNPEGNPEGQV